MNLRSIASLFALGSLVWMPSGCAVHYVPSPTAGRSRLEQVLLSSTIDEAVNQMTQSGLDPLTGKKVFVRVGDLEDSGKDADYVRTTLEMRLSSLGVVPVDSDAAADVVMIVRVRTAGIDRSSRDDTLLGLLNVFSLLLRYQKVWCAAELDSQAVDEKNGTILLSTRPTGSATNKWTEWSILPIIFSGPFSLNVQTCTVDSPLLD